MIDEKKLIEDILQHENVLASANHVYKSGYRDRQYEIIDTIKRQPKVSEWIPVSERLPDELVAVNVTWINRCPQNYYMHIKDKPFTDTAVLYRGEWYWWDNTIIDYLSEYGAYVFETVDKSIDILAWQPLPEPMRLEIEALEKQATSGWIPVSERLPENADEYVLITVNGKYKNITYEDAIMLAVYDKDEGWIIDGYQYWLTAQVTAWLPLPEPYKGESK